MLQEEQIFIDKIKNFDVESLEVWQIAEYLKQLNIEWYNLDRLKQYGKTWEQMFVWCYNTVGFAIIKKMNPSLIEFTRSLEACKLGDMVDEYNKLNSDILQTNEIEFL